MAAAPDDAKKLLAVCDHTPDPSSSRLLNKLLHFGFGSHSSILMIASLPGSIFAARSFSPRKDARQVHPRVPKIQQEHLPLRVSMGSHPQKPPGGSKVMTQGARGQHPI